MVMNIVLTLLMVQSVALSLSATKKTQDDFRFLVATTFLLYGYLIMMGTWTMTAPDAGWGYIYFKLYALLMMVVVIIASIVAANATW